jgi:hypothetical protein
MAEIRFDPTVVESCATAAHGVGDTVSRTATGFANTAEVIGKHGGLAAAQALGACRTGWSARIGGDGGGASTIGDNLHRAVQDHTSTDQHNADGFGDGRRPR